jgi:hypothetical protein
MIETLTADGFTPADALRISRSLREFTIGHVLTMAVLTLGADRRSRRPAPSDPAYNLLAEAADDTTPGDHFDRGLQAMLDGFSGGRGRTRGRR